jgi:cobalt-zinc-cadmium efflux system outer membrane protein
MRLLTLFTAIALLPASSIAQEPAAAARAVTLTELEELALQNHPATVASAAGVTAARERARQSAAWPNPIVGYSGEEVTAGAPEKRGQHGFFVEQTIPLGGKLQLSRSALEKSVQQTEAARDLQRLRILSSVRRSFYSVLLMERRIEVQERLAALASEAVGVTAQLFNVGAADRPDFLEIEIESRRIQLRLNRSRNELVALRAALAAAVGVADVGSRPLAGRIDEALPVLERDAAVRAVIEQSPELRIARAELEQTRAITARAGRETFPDLHLRGGGAYNREPWDSSDRSIGWQGTLEAGISVPLFNRNTSGVAAARADEARAQAELTRVELALESRAAILFANYAAARDASAAHRTEILPRAEEAYRLYLTRYREMAAAYPQVLVAQRTLFELSAEYFDHLNEAWQAALNLQSYLAER